MKYYSNGMHHAVMLICGNLSSFDWTYIFYTCPAQNDQVLRASELGDVVYLTSLLNSGGDIDMYNNVSVKKVISFHNTCTCRYVVAIVHERKAQISGQFCYTCKS